MKIRRRRAKKSRSVPITGEVQEILDAQREAFRTKFGRDPGPRDPLFFDPDAVEPQPFDSGKVEREVVRAMQAAGIAPRLIFAYRRTGLLVSTDNWSLLSARDRAEWQAALDVYDELESRSN